MYLSKLPNINVIITAKNKLFKISFFKKKGVFTMKYLHDS